jgi:hypothetical protein
MLLIPITALATALLAAAPAAQTTATAPANGPAAAGRHMQIPDNGTLALDTQSGPVKIPIDLRGNHIYMRGRINDSDSLWIVLDSGASGDVVDESVAKRLGLEIAAMTQGRGAGGTVDAGQIRSVSIRLPGATLEGSPIVSMPLGAFERQSGRPMEVIVGYPLISRCVIKLDYLSRTLELIPAKTFKYKGSGKVVPVTFLQNHPYVTARVTVPGRKKPIQGRFVIDLGSSMALILSPWAIHEYQLNEAITNTIEALGRGVGGQVPSRMGRVTSLDLGGFKFQNPITTMPLSDQAHISADGNLGNIGGEFMRRFTVYFDYSRSHMILEPNTRLNDPFESDMSGIAPRMGPDGSQALEVEWVQSVSPAAEVGIKAADLIEQVDGKPALEVGVPGLKEMFRHPGETHHLTIRRGDEHLEISLTTRRLI